MGFKFSVVGVINAMDDLLVSSQFSIMYVCMFAVAISNLGRYEIIVRSSAYEAMCELGSMVWGMSCMYRLKSVGERTDP